MASASPSDGGFSYPPPGQTAKTGSNGLAIGALVCGLLSVPLGILLAPVGIILGLVAIVLGFLGVRKANELGGTGKGMAITGIVSGLLGALLGVLIIGAVVTLFNDPEVQDAIESISAVASEAAS